MQRFFDLPIDFIAFPFSFIYNFGFSKTNSNSTGFGGSITGGGVTTSSDSLPSSVAFDFFFLVLGGFGGIIETLKLVVHPGTLLSKLQLESFSLATQSRKLKPTLWRVFK